MDDLFCQLHHICSAILDYSHHISILIFYLYQLIRSTSYRFYVISAFSKYFEQDTPVGEIFNLSGIISWFNKDINPVQIVEFCIC